MTDLAAYVVYARQDTSLEEAQRVPATRWAVESCFKAAKCEVGLGHYEVRRWTSWFRHITLAWQLLPLGVGQVSSIRNAE
jgi:SRSO17 transposase